MLATLLPYAFLFLTRRLLLLFVYTNANEQKATQINRQLCYCFLPLDPHSNVVAAMKYEYFRELIDIFMVLVRLYKETKLKAKGRKTI